MTMTSPSEERDIDGDPTLEIDALDEARLAVLDLRPDPRDPTRSELSCELQARLCRLTPPAPSPQLARPRHRPDGHLPRLAARLVRARSSTVIVVAAVSRLARAHGERFIVASARLVAQLGQTLRQLVVDYFARGRRRRTAALYRAQRARWKAPAIAQARAWRQVVNLFDARTPSRR